MNLGRRIMGVWSISCVKSSGQTFYRNSVKIDDIIFIPPNINIQDANIYL